MRDKNKIKKKKKKLLRPMKKVLAEKPQKKETTPAYNFCFYRKLREIKYIYIYEIYTQVITLNIDNGIFQR